MNMETLFTLSNVLVLPFWLLILLAPRWRVTRRVIGSPLIVVPIALLYSALVLPGLPALLPTLANPGLAAIAEGFGTPQGATAAWAHLLAFDLFTGRWAYLDSRAREMSPWLAGPVIFFIFMLGPFGLLLYLVARELGPRGDALRGALPLPQRACCGNWWRRKWGSVPSRCHQPNRIARIQIRIQHIRGQVGQRETYHRDHGHRLHQRQVPAVDGEDQQTAQARIVEDVLDHDQAADQPAEADGDDGDGGQQGVAQHVLDDHGALGQALERRPCAHTAFFSSSTTPARVRRAM